MIYNNTKCAVCGKTLIKEGEKELWEEDKKWGFILAPNWAYRLYCSNKCHSIMQERKRKEKRKEKLQNMKCVNCERLFNGGRRDQKFCSGKCRVAYFRKNKCPISKNKNKGGFPSLVSQISVKP